MGLESDVSRMISEGSPVSAQKPSFKNSRFPEAADRTAPELKTVWEIAGQPMDPVVLFSVMSMDGRE